MGIMAMCNPFGFIFGDIFLGYYENQWLINCSNDFKPLFYSLLIVLMTLNLYFITY